MRYCIFCGVRIPLDAKYCQICGKEQLEFLAAAIGQPTEAESHPVEKKSFFKSKLKLIIGGVVLFCLLIACLTFIAVLLLR